MVLHKPSLFWSVLLVALTVFLSACGDKNAKARDGKNIDENTFVSEYFALRMQKPDSWAMLESDQNENLMDNGRSLAAGSNRSLEKTLEASVENTVTLATFIKYDPSLNVRENPSVITIAENVKSFPDVKTSAQYFDHFKVLAAQTQFDYQYGDEYQQVMIGGQPFDLMEVKIGLGGNYVAQRYYAARFKDYMLVFIETWINDTYAEESKSIINSIELGW